MPTNTSPQVVVRLCSPDEVPSGTSRSFEVGPHKNVEGDDVLMVIS